MHLRRKPLLHLSEISIEVSEGRAPENGKLVEQKKYTNKCR
jgi:hypothetical protein